jgi:hypothetical protein
VLAIASSAVAAHHPILVERSPAIFVLLYETPIGTVFNSDECLRTYTGAKNHSAECGLPETTYIWPVNAHYHSMEVIAVTPGSPGWSCRVTLNMGHTHYEQGVTLPPDPTLEVPYEVLTDSEIRAGDHVEFLVTDGPLGQCTSSAKPELIVRLYGHWTV